jgi:hypothetical protein
MRMAILLAACLILVPACSETNWRPASDAVWTESELKNLEGKTREEIKEVLGAPTGLYTIDAKGRWHYPHMNVIDRETGETVTATVKIYFSQLGDQRATIIEITKRRGE